MCTYSFDLSFCCVSVLKRYDILLLWLGSCSVATSVWTSLSWRRATALKRLEGRKEGGGAAVNISLVVQMTLTRSAGPLGLPQISP